MRVLGIDPGSQTMGWGVVDGDGRRYSLVAFGAIRASSALRFSARLLKMCTGLEEVIAQHRPDGCAHEAGASAGCRVVVGRTSRIGDSRVFTAAHQADDRRLW